MRTELKSHSNQVPTVSQPAAAVASTMKPTVIWLAYLLVLCLSSVSMAAASVGPPRPPSGSRWLWSWLPKSAAVDLRSTDFQKKNNLPLVRLKKDHMDVLRLKKDAGNGKRDMDVLRLKKSIIKERNNIDR